MLSRSARHFVSGLVGFILIPMFTKHLGAAQYGVWVLAQSVTGYLTLMEFGLTTTLIRHLAAAKATGDYDQANRVLGQLATLMWAVAGLITLGAVVGSLLLPYAFRLDPDQVALFQWAFLMIGVQAALGVVTNIWEGTMAAAEDYHVLNGLYIFAALARLAYSVILLKLGYGLLALLGAQFGVIGMVWLLDHLYLKWRYPQLSLRPRWFGWEEAKPLAKFSGAVFVSQIAGLLANDTDKVIAGIFLGPTAVAIYQVGYKLYDLARSLIANMPTVLMPTAAALHARSEEDRLRRMLCQISSVMVAIIASIYIPFILYGREFILWWVGPKFEQSAIVLAFLSGAMLVSASNRILGSVLWGTGDYRVMVVAPLSYAIANAGLSVVLCLWWGIVGIAAATMLTAIPVHTFLAAYAIRKFQVNFWDYAGRACTGALLGSLVGWTLSRPMTIVHVNGLGQFLLQGIAFEVSFWVVILIVGFTPQMRTHFMQLIPRPR
jgi:O-antigen/teichoic acid export membrane protein